MPSIHHSHPGDSVSALIAQSDPFPPGCDPDFDADYEELERQLAAIRLSFDHN